MLNALLVNQLHGFLLTQKLHSAILGVTHAAAMHEFSTFGVEHKTERLITHGLQSSLSTPSRSLSAVIAHYQNVWTVLKDREGEFSRGRKEGFRIMPVQRFVCFIANPPVLMTFVYDSAFNEPTASFHP